MSLRPEKNFSIHKDLFRQVFQNHYNPKKLYRLRYKAKSQHAFTAWYFIFLINQWNQGIRN